MEIPLPPHAYVPGQTVRHPEGWFDALKTPEMAMTVGVHYFDQGFYWECHEVLEAEWMRAATHSLERDIVQAIIQLANARLKLRMDRPKAAARLCAIVMDLLEDIPANADPLGQSPAHWRGQLMETMEAL